MISDILYDPKYLGLLLIYALAIFYIAECIVDFSTKLRYIKKLKDMSDESYILRWNPFARHELKFINGGTYAYTFPFDFKPLNCQLCLMGWISIIVYLVGIPLEYLAPFAVAGAAVLVWKIVYRLETFIS